MKKIVFYSIREKPEYVDAILKSQTEHWWACMPWTKKHLQECLGARVLPDTYVAVRDGELVGMYTLLLKKLLYSETVDLWIGTLYIFPEARGEHISPVLMEHARLVGGILGYAKIYLASDHVQYYEKFGFRKIGPDLCVWGEPTKMYEHDTLRAVGFTA